MKKIFLLLLSFAACLPPSAHAQIDYVVFKVKATLPAVMDIPTMAANDIVVRKTLTTNDVVNLALGQPMNTRVDSHTAVLALAFTFETSGTTTPSSKLIVFNPSAAGSAQQATVVGTLSNLDWDSAYLTRGISGQGIGTGSIHATTLGDPAKNGFLESPVTGGGSCSGPHAFNQNNRYNPVGSATMACPVQFVYTTGTAAPVNFNGFITRGVLTVSGHAIGAYTD